MEVMPPLGGQPRGARLPLLGALSGALLAALLPAPLPAEDGGGAEGALVEVSAAPVPGRGLLALSFRNRPGWHTYWKNPGDAGLPIGVAFTIDGREAELRALEWPVPGKFVEDGGVVGYGYDGSYSLFFELPRDLALAHAGGVLIADVSWLACRHVCIPGKQSVVTTLDASPGSGGARAVGDNPGQDELLRRLAALPEPGPLPPYLSLDLGLDEDGDGLVFLYRLAREPMVMLSGLDLLTPFPHDSMSFRHERLRVDGEGLVYGERPADWDGAYATPPSPLPTDGAFSPPLAARFLLNDPITGRVSIVEATFEFFNPKSYVQMKGFLGGLAPYGHVAEADPTGGVLFYLLLAFLGGLILNAMPCVLPVISIKLFGLVKNARRSRAKVLRHNLLYALGVEAAFVGLGLFVIALKSVGENVAWGFQLQSPGFVAVMVFVMVLLSLNFFGLFEFALPFGRTLGRVRIQDGPWGDFLGGVLATVLATPCSAPFLGTALTFAFNAEPAVILAVFLVIGLGLSSPFLAIGLFPSTISLLPSPGIWMDHLKKFLGLGLLLSAVWLGDVFSAQVGDPFQFVKLQLMAVFLFFAFYFWANVSKGAVPGAAVFALPSLFLFDVLTSNLDPPAPAADGGPGRTAGIRPGGLDWEPWTVGAMEDYRSRGERAFIDFTAKWCFTCKVNERLVLETDGFRDLVREKGVRLLLADWTRRDPVIGDWLRARGFVGVPAYFAVVDGEVKALGETITLGEIRAAFDGGSPGGDSLAEGQP